MKQTKVAYIMSRFPGLSETFILREMDALERLGWKIELFPLVLQKDRIVHDEARPWMPRAHNPAFAAVAVANLKLLITHPLVYTTLAAKVVLGNILNPKFLVRSLYIYVKAVEMANIMRSEKIAHIHAHYATHPALTAFIINQITGIPYSVTVHAHDIFVHKTMLAEKLGGAKGIIAISKFNRQYLMEMLGESIGIKTHVIHCGVNPTLYSQNLSISDPFQGRFEIISIGSLRLYKGFMYLLDACAILKKSGFSFRCRIVGGGELKNELMAQIERLDLSGFVELIGPKTQTEVASLLGMSDCYVQPSIITATGKMEGIPVSLMEAMASKLPVVATDISGIPELVHQNTTGWLVPPENPKAIAEAILQVYDGSEQAKFCAEMGRNLVLNEFDIDTNAMNLSNLFKDFIEDKL